MYINDVHELVQALAQASVIGKVHSVQVAKVEELGIPVTEKLQEIEFFGTTPGEVLDSVDAGKVEASTFIACVNAALRDMV